MDMDTISTYPAGQLSSLQGVAMDFLFGRCKPLKVEVDGGDAALRFEPHSESGFTLTELRRNSDGMWGETGSSTPIASFEEFMGFVLRQDYTGD